MYFRPISFSTPLRIFLYIDFVSVASYHVNPLAVPRWRKNPDLSQRSSWSPERSNSRPPPRHIDHPRANRSNSRAYWVYLNEINGISGSRILPVSRRSRQWRNPVGETTSIKLRFGLTVTNTQQRHFGLGFLRFMFQLFSLLLTASLFLYFPVSPYFLLSFAPPPPLLSLSPLFPNVLSFRWWMIIKDQQRKMNAENWWRFDVRVCETSLWIERRPKLTISFSQKKPFFNFISSL